ncbi:MAG: hypothetical protein J7545_04760 [Roseofilum sp. SBFL]|uniref:hypothetical protein n=2 Tax=unclassified Roseofilum TaxID=2620099 RepID=UPI001B1DEB50|nr:MULTISPECIES: hypothetical protein [unclassified Roseofilum]MBP0026313.1 hypothetical protein [Roseofilum sp. SID2]MBP0041274.1 hypothetical protein [Roseofilum sp. SBFL]
MAVLMRILPYDRFTLETPASVAEVIGHLEPHIEAPKIWQWRVPPNHAPYCGTISEDGFKIRRVIHYRNSFLPQVRGRFESLPNGTAVHITLSLHPMVSIFLIFWGSSWGSASLLFLFAALFSEDVGLETLLFIPLPFIVLFIFWCAFWLEANRACQDLSEILRIHH